MLKRKESKWVTVQLFRPNMVSISTSPKQKPAAINTSQSGMPQDGPKDVEMTAPAANNSLRPTAAEFKPQSTTSVPLAIPKPAVAPKILTQVSSAASAHHAEEEDGEVKDGKDSKSSADPAQAGQAKVESRAGRLTVQDRGATKELTSREKITTQGDRATTPKPFAAAPAPTSTSGSRGDNSRPPSATSRLGGLPHGLPSRPDVPIPGHYRGQPGIPERPPAPTPRDSRDGMPTREAKEPREPRRDPRELAREPREPPRDPARLDRREAHDSDRRPLEATSREPGRLSERDSSSRSESSTRRVESSSERLGRDRGQTSGRDTRGSREHTTPTSQPQPPPQPPATRSAPHEPPINPQRAALWQADGKTEIVDSQRTALTQDSRSGSSARPARDSGRERDSSRTSSPRRDDRPIASLPSEDYGREERHGRRNGNVAEAPPQLPRGMEQPRDSGGRTLNERRDASFQGPPAPSRESNRNRSSQQDPNFGRLTSSVPDTPQNLRGRGASRSSSRISSLPTASRPDGNMPPPDLPRAPSPTRQPPTEPSSARGRRTQSSQFEQNQVSGGGGATVPTTSIGMHPDRIRQFESVGPSAQSPPPPPPPPPPGGPPSRPRPIVPPIHTNDRVNAPTGPSNLRHGQGSLPNTPIRENHAPQSAPTGPAASQDRHNKSGARRQLNTIQNSIAANRRDDGRRLRASMPDSDAQILTGASPTATPVQERSDPVRRMPMPEFPQTGSDDNSLRSREPPRPGTQSDDFSMPRASESDRSVRRDHRSERPSRHGGRERSPRGEGDVRDRRGTETHDRHDRRPGPPPAVDLNRDPNLEPIAPRRSLRDLQANNTNRELLPGSGREPTAPSRDLRHRGDGRVDSGRVESGRVDNGRLDASSSGRLGEDWSGGGRGGSMRGAPREGPREGPRDGGSGRFGGDDRRDSRGDDRTSSRKRRSDVNEIPPNDRDKRLRR